jgi:hypothetical protein
MVVVVLPDLQGSDCDSAQIFCAVFLLFVAIVSGHAIVHHCAGGCVLHGGTHYKQTISEGMFSTTLPCLHALCACASPDWLTLMRVLLLLASEQEDCDLVEMYALLTTFVTFYLNSYLVDPQYDTTVRKT